MKFFIVYLSFLKVFLAINRNNNENIQKSNALLIDIIKAISIFKLRKINRTNLVYQKI